MFDLFSLLERHFHTRFTLQFIDAGYELDVSSLYIQLSLFSCIKGRCHLIVDLVESRKAALFCSDFWIRASFGHYYGENRFSKAFLHIFTAIMLFQLDLSRISPEICSSDFYTPLLSRGPNIKVLQPQWLAEEITQQHLSNAA